MIPSGLPNLVPFRWLWGDEVPSSTNNQDKAREKVSKALEKRSIGHSSSLEFKVI